LSSCGVDLDSDGVKAMAAGNSHTVALKSDGTLWAWGYNLFGQLGDGTTNNRSYPVQVSSFKDVKAVAVGSGYTVALKNDGTLWTWGYNGFGQLGDGTTNNRSYPVQVKNADNSPFKDVKAVAVGYTYTLALKTDGTLWAWGWNASGQLGDGTSGMGGTTADKRYPVQVKNADSTPFTDVKSVAAGNSYTVALKNDGTLWAWGDNGFGQLGLGDTADRYSPVRLGEAADLVGVYGGFYFSTALRRSGMLWTWGQNDDGQLGNGTPTGTNCLIPKAVKWE